MVYVIDIIFTKRPKSNLNNYTCIINHRGYKIRRYELDYTFVELVQHIGYLYYCRANIVRLIQKSNNTEKVIINEFKNEY